MFKYWGPTPSGRGWRRSHGGWLRSPTALARNTSDVAAPELQQQGPQRQWAGGQSSNSDGDGDDTEAPTTVEDVAPPDGVGSHGRDAGEESEHGGRPGVPNRLVLLPVYPTSAMLEKMCAMFPGNMDRWRALCEIAQLQAHMTVVDFTEQFALCVKDLDEEQALIGNLDPVDFWMQIQDKLQLICSQKLKARHVVGLQYNHKGPPYSFDTAEHGVEDDAKATGEANTEVGGPHREQEAQQAVDSEGLPILSLKIPEQQDPFRF